MATDECDLVTPLEGITDGICQGAASLDHEAHLPGSQIGCGNHGPKRLKEQRHGQLVLSRIEWLKPFHRTVRDEACILKVDIWTE